MSPTARRVVTPTHEYVELVPSDDDFLAFWTQHRAKSNPETKTILGCTVPVPTDMPLALQDMAEELQASQDPNDVDKLVSLLFGVGVYTQWKANGITDKMLGVLMAWGMANAAGQSTTFEQAAEMAAEAEAAKGKALKPVPNRADRRASSKTRASASTGR